MKRRFKVRLDYFKPSGKWYAEGTYDHDLKTCGDEPPGSNVAYSYDLVDEVRVQAQIGSLAPLPGLVGGWDGPILIRILGRYDDSGNYVADEYVCRLIPARVGS